MIYLMIFDHYELWPVIRRANKTRPCLNKRQKWSYVKPNRYVCVLYQITVLILLAGVEVILPNGLQEIVKGTTLSADDLPGRAVITS